jgi:hypothetical protein
MMIPSSGSIVGAPAQDSSQSAPGRLASKSSFSGALDRIGSEPAQRKHTPVVDKRRNAVDTGGYDVKVQRGVAVIYKDNTDEVLDVLQDGQGKNLDDGSTVTFYITKDERGRPNKETIAVKQGRYLYVFSRRANSDDLWARS